MPRVSVVIPTYNCAAYIEETLDSVLAQDHEDVEIIIVDDGSTDSTPQIAAKRAPGARMVCQSNAGVCVARNNGIALSTGDYVCLLDHDDYWFPGKLTRQLTAFDERPEVGVVFSNFLPWNRDRSGNFPAPSSHMLERFPDQVDSTFSGWIYHLFLLDCWMLTSTAMFRRDVFERCGAFDATLPYSEDWDLWLRVARHFPFVKLERPTTLYRQHAQQGSRVVRDVDYRTALLKRAVSQWGLCSPDGKCLSNNEFLRQLAHYHAAFGFWHLQHGKRGIALRAIAEAWRTDPLRVKYLGYLCAALVGWKPSWS